MGSTTDSNATQEGAVSNTNINYEPSGAVSALVSTTVRPATPPVHPLPLANAAETTAEVASLSVGAVALSLPNLAVTTALTSPHALVPSTAVTAAVTGLSPATFAATAAQLATLDLAPGGFHEQQQQQSRAGQKRKVGPKTVPKKAALFKHGKRRKRRGSAPLGLAFGSKSAAAAAAAAGTTSASKKRQRIKVADDCPDRTVNPLTEIPATARTAGEWLPLLDLQYPSVQDTYSIAYAARLLGFDVAPTATATSQYTCGQPPFSSGSSINVSDHPILQQDDVESYKAVPGKGTFAQTVWLRESTASADNHSDRDAAATATTSKNGDSMLHRSGRMDPFYTSLLQAPPACTAPVTAPQQSRLLQTADGPKGAVTMEPVMAAARQYLSAAASNDWSWQSLHEFQGRHAAGTQSLPWPAQSQAAAGLFVLRDNIPVGLVTYKFQWVPLEPSTITTTSATTTTTTAPQQQSVETTAPLEPAASSTATATSELIMRLHELIQPDGSFFRKQQQWTVPEECILLLLTALCLEHARVCNVWYAVLQVPPKLAAFMQRYFRMSVVLGANTSSHTAAAAKDDFVDMVCDLHKCSYRYAFLLYRQDKTSGTSVPVALPTASPPVQLLLPHRYLVRLPNAEDVKAALAPPAAVPATTRPIRGIPRKVGAFLSGATGQARQATVSLRAKLQPDESLQVVRLDAQGREGAAVEAPTFYTETSLDIMREFALAPKAPAIDAEREGKEEKDEIVCELAARQQELEQLEKGLEPSLRFLLGKVVDERMQYESAEAVGKREEEKRILLENKKMLERREEMDTAWQKQLEQDMDAVCDICNDGEVTPDNQILFCESCNVAVHQFCYGVERVPEGDYYCLACTHLGRNRTGAVIRDDAPKQSATPLTICCELCPLKQGAFIQTNMKPKQGETGAFGKWVHVVCAKWQGLHFVDDRKPDLVEDVADLKVTFRRFDVKCQLCLGDRGAMNLCRFEGCNKWIHVTCARATGTCDVVHGENTRGPVAKNAWTLMCPEHSNIDSTEVPIDAINIDRLVTAAKEFPPEPMPPALPLVRMPFNQATGKERKLLLADDEYEQELFQELLNKKMFGIRCEVCDECEENGKNLNRCTVCYAVVCYGCTYDTDIAEGSGFKCASCSYMNAKKKQDEKVEAPNCVGCFQKGGLLRRASAKPMKKTHWTKNPNEYKRSLFGRDIFTHSLCSFWNPGVSISFETGEVDLSMVVLSNGKAFVHPTIKCFLCGNAGGLKNRCDHEGCKVKDGDKQVPVSFHVTCARQAGLEVQSEQVGRKTLHSVKCYRHAGNEFNLRARLEDLLEIEKKRSGKTLAKADQPMKFSDASRLLNAALLVTRILGWAWRWAEWWVDYNSTWEPLLEAGEREEDMTPEQLRIVKCTRESRCEDARKCRLAQLGAALRCRKYDTEKGFDRKALDSALRAVLQTKSLVGPLVDREIDFFADWLGRAYRSKSRLLGFDEDKIVVSKQDFCLHLKDQTPKYELGSRSVPGIQQVVEAGGQLVEAPADVDDFLQTEILKDEVRVSPRRQGGNSDGTSPPRRPSRLPKYRDSVNPSDTEEEEPVVKKKLGRPFQKRAIESAQEEEPVVKKKLGRPFQKRAIESAPEEEPVVKKKLGRPFRKRTIESAQEEDPVVKKKLGRPFRKRTIESAQEEEPVVKKKLDRPFQKRTIESTQEDEPIVNKKHNIESAEEAMPPPKKRVGRPPKKRIGRPPKKRPAEPPLEPTSPFTAEPEATVTRRGRRSSPQKVTEPSMSLPVMEDDDLDSSFEMEPPPPKKRRGGQPKVRLPPADSIEQQAVGSAPSAEDRSGWGQGSCRSVEASAAPAAVSMQQENSDTLPEPRPVKKRRGRPPKRFRDEDYHDQDTARSTPTSSASTNEATISDYSNVVDAEKAMPTAILGTPQRVRGRKRHTEEATPAELRLSGSKSDLVKHRRHKMQQNLVLEQEEGTSESARPSPAHTKWGGKVRQSEDYLTVADSLDRKRSAHSMGVHLDKMPARKASMDSGPKANAGVTEDDIDAPVKNETLLDDIAVKSSEASTLVAAGERTSEWAAAQPVSTDMNVVANDGTPAVDESGKSEVAEPSETRATASEFVTTSNSTDTKISAATPGSEKETQAGGDTLPVKNPSNEATTVHDDAASNEADTPSKRGRRRGKMEAARTILIPDGAALEE